MNTELSLDVDALKSDIARRAIERACEPETSEPDGQLTFGGLGRYDYEPSRLVLGAAGDIIENARAKPEHKAAEARRAMDDANRALRQALRRHSEASHFSDWALEQLRSGRSWTEVAFDNFVREGGVRVD